MSETKGRCRSEVDMSGSGGQVTNAIADAIDRLAADVAAVKATVCGNSPKTSDSSPAAPQPVPPPAGVSDEQVAMDKDRAAVQRYCAAPQPAAPAAGWLTDEERHILSAHLQSLREQRRAMERGGQTLGYSANPCGLKREADAIDALLARAGSPPEQTAALWLTEEERAVVEDIASMIQQWFKMAWSDIDEKRCAVLRSILARAGSPPSQTAAGWLTEEERELLALVNGMADDYSWDPRSTWRCNWPYSRVSLVVKALLARAGSPPVVEVPDLPSNHYARSEAERYRAALDKAGVAWEEVPRE